MLQCRIISLYFVRRVAHELWRVFYVYHSHGIHRVASSMKQNRIKGILSL